MDIKELALKVAEEVGIKATFVCGKPDECPDDDACCHHSVPDGRWLKQGKLEKFATRLIAAYTEGQEPDESQNWKGMSGAVAWHLIDRHGEDWADIGNKMDAWLKANTAPPLPAIPDERIATLEKQRDELLVALELCKFDSLNMSLEDLGFIRSVVAKVKQP